MFLIALNSARSDENKIHSHVNAVNYHYERIVHRRKAIFDLPCCKNIQRLPKIWTRMKLQKRKRSPLI